MIYTRKSPKVQQQKQSPKTEKSLGKTNSFSTYMCSMQKRLQMYNLLSDATYKVLAYSGHFGCP